MRVILFFASIFVSGCALSPVELASKSNLDLCMNYLTKPQSLYRGQVVEELNRRGENCGSYTNQAAALINANASGNASMAAGVSLLNQGSPTPVAPAPPIRCTTYQNGPWGTATCQ
jgi:hypothetical protein